jgi:hypothetical protein
VRRFLAFLYFLMLVNDGQAKSGQYIAIYAQSFWTPTEWAQAVLFDPIAGVRLFDLLLLVGLLVGLGSRDGKGARVRPMRSALLLAATTILLWFGWGVARGGDAHEASWQIYLLLGSILASFSLAANFRTAEHYMALAKAVVLAGFYRATMCLIFYFGWVRNKTFGPEGPPQTMTTHDDTVLWVSVIILLLVNATELRGRRATMTAVLGIPYLILAIQENNRRLAWVSLVGALIAYIALLRPGRAKSAMKRGLVYLTPVALAYVVIGWGRTEKIFKPLASFASVSTSEDASTLARNAENLGLIATAHAHGWVLGSGWGHKYIELTNKYSIANAFDLWQYVPHNSILGLLAFLGMVGFIGFWLRLPVAVFLHSRVARVASRPADRAVGVACVPVVIVCCNQMYGDMGCFSLVTMYMLGAVYAAALRVPIESKTWGTARPAPAPPQAA